MVTCGVYICPSFRWFVSVFLVGVSVGAGVGLCLRVVVLMLFVYVPSFKRPPRVVAHCGVRSKVSRRAVASVAGSEGNCV